MILTRYLIIALLHLTSLRGLGEATLNWKHYKHGCHFEVWRNVPYLKTTMKNVRVNQLLSSYEKGTIHQKQEN